MVHIHHNAVRRLDTNYLPRFFPTHKPVTGPSHRRHRRHRSHRISITPSHRPASQRLRHRIQHIMRRHFAIRPTHRHRICPRLLRRRLITRRHREREHSRLLRRPRQHPAHRIKAHPRRHRSRHPAAERPHPRNHHRPRRILLPNHPVTHVLGQPHPCLHIHRRHLRSHVLTCHLHSAQIRQHAIHFLHPKAMHAVRRHRITHRLPCLGIDRPDVPVKLITPRHHFIPLIQRLRSRLVIPVRPAIRPRKLRLHQLPLGLHFVRLAIPPVLVTRIVRIIGNQIPQLHLPVVVRRRPDLLHPHRLPELLHRHLRRLRRLNHRLHLRRCRRHRRIIHKHRRRHLHHSPVHQIPRPIIHQPVIPHRRRRRHVTHPEMLAPKLTLGFVNICPSVAAIGPAGIAVYDAHVPSAFFRLAHRITHFGCPATVLSSVIFGTP